VASALSTGRRGAFRAAVPAPAFQGREDVPRRVKDAYSEYDYPSRMPPIVRSTGDFYRKSVEWSNGRLSVGRRYDRALKRNSLLKMREEGRSGVTRDVALAMRKGGQNALDMQCRQTQETRIQNACG